MLNQYLLAKLKVYRSRLVNPASKADAARVEAGLCLAARCTNQRANNAPLCRDHMYQFGVAVAEPYANSSPRFTLEKKPSEIARGLYPGYTE